MFSLKGLSSDVNGRRKPEGARLQFVRSITTAIQSSPDLLKGLAEAGECTVEQLGCRHLVIVLRDGENWATAAICRSEKTTQTCQTRQTLSPAAIELIKDLKEVRSIVSVNEAEAVSELMGDLSGRDIESLWILAAPLTDCSLVIGAVIAGFANDGALAGGTSELPDDPAYLLEIICFSLASAVRQKRSEEKEASATRRWQALSGLHQALESAASVEDVVSGPLDRAVEAVGKALSFNRVVVYASGQTDRIGSGPMVALAEFRDSDHWSSVLGQPLALGGNGLVERLLSGGTLAIANVAEADPIVRASAIQNGVKSLICSPVRTHDRTLAVLALEQLDGQRSFSDDELELIRALSAHIASAIRQCELSREANETARRGSVINNIVKAIHGSLDLFTGLRAIASELGKSLHACRCDVIVLPEPMPEQLPIEYAFVAACCESKVNGSLSVPVAGNKHLQSVIASEIPLAINDVDEDPAALGYREYFEQTGAKSMLAASVRLAGRPIGIISLIQSDDRRKWTRSEIDLLHAVAGHAAITMRQAELYSEARDSATRAALLNQIFNAIRRSLDLDEILQVAVRELGHALNASRVVFRKLVADDLVVAAEYLENSYESLSDVRDSATAYNLHALAEARRTLVIDDVRAFAAAYPDIASRVESWGAEGATRSEIVCPIFVNYDFWGALSIHQTNRARRWTPSEIALVEAVTAQIEIAVSHSHLFEEATGAARREALIGRIINGINQSNRVDQILPLVAREIADCLGCDSLSIVDYRPETGTWTSICQYSRGEISRSGREYSGRDFPGLLSNLEDAALVSADVEKDHRLRPILAKILRPAGIKSFAAVPVRYQDLLRLAIVAVMHRPRIWSDEEIEVLKAAADQVLNSLQRAELFEQISRGKHEWESTFDALTDGIFIFDRDGILRRVNQAGAAFEGKNITELVGRRCCTLLEGVEIEGCQVSAVIQTGKATTFELTPRRLTQSLLVTIFPLFDQPAAQAERASGAVCVVRDLSQLRAVEAVAREQRNFLVKLIEHANDAIFALSPEGRFVWFNEQLARLSGYSRDELFSSDFRRFLTETDKRLAIDRFTRALTGEAQTFEMHGVRKNGESRLLLMTYTPIYDKGRISSVLCIARDITEERLAAERAAQADKLRALGQLASGVAHNFNNILAAILGHAQLIKRDNPDDRLTRRVEIIEKAALDGAQTVKRIQGFALQQDETVFEPIDANQLVQDSANLTRARWADEAQASGLPYEVELRLAPTSQLVLGSASELREVFVNIILNALDAMPQGGRLLISTETKESVIQISFSDSGVGMSRPVRERIFEPFFTTKGTRGMGLGLAVSYSIIERHGGRIEVDSSPGRGSTFVIALPLKQATANTSKEVRLTEGQTADVLVIDDDQPVREAIVDMLISAGHRADQAASGREGLNLMENRRFNIVFTDLSMPEMDGWAVASEIRRRWPDVKVVLATGYAVPPETIRSHTDLVSEVIFKPIRFDDITATLNRVLA